MDRSTAILERFRTLYPREIDLSLDRMTRLMAKLGHPERRMPPVIHVAGTNGKGSTVAFMRAMLEAAGKSVHVYTSPHLVRFHERMRIGRPGGSRFVEEDALVEAFLAVERANGDEPVPQFEITTAAAFRLFAEHPADFALLEVGLGGRYDATNIIDDPVVAVITPVAFDHEKFLGSSLAQIAGEKAGIIKRGRPVVVAPQQPIVADVIEAEAARLGAPEFAGNRDWIAHGEHGGLVYQDEDGLLDLPGPRLVGRHQLTNAGTAIAALRRAKLGIPRTAIAAGLTAVDWPGRLQRLTEGALIGRAPAAAELWLDGGHNPSAGRGDRRGDGRSRGTGAEPAGADRRHAQHQGPGRVLPAVRRTGAAGAHRAGAGHQRRPRPGRACRSGRDRRLDGRGDGRVHVCARSSQGGAWRRGAAAHPDRGLALPCRRGARRQRNATYVSTNENRERSAPGSAENLRFQAVQIACLIHSLRRPFGAAPICWETGWPPLNMIRVGIERTP